MSDMKSTIEEVSAQLVEQSKGVENPKLRATTERIAENLAQREREEMISAARAAHFCRVPFWAFFLKGVSKRQMLVLGRVYSFQCTASKDGTGGEFRMKLEDAAKELNFYDGHELARDLRKLTKLGFLTKTSEGGPKTATYLVDEVACMTEARRNGYPG